jgi:hypothetical protein
MAHEMDHEMDYEMAQTEGVTDLNYFVCTLGQAASIKAKNHRQFMQVNDFVDCQARAFPNRPAVGFPTRYPNGEWDFVITSECFSPFMGKCGNIANHSLND